MDPVLPSGDLPPGSPPRRVKVAGAGVMVARLAEGRVVAFSATCPHQRTDLGDATLCDGRVRCPLHLYEYDLETGENVVPTRDLDGDDLRKAAPGRLPVYRTEERHGWISVAEPPTEPPPAPAPPAAAGAGELVGVVAGTTFELRLPTSSRPGFLWRVEAANSLVAVVGERQERGEHVVRLAARAGGRSTVRCLYARPWDREPAEVRTYEVRIQSP